ncbi:MAG: hypothetical protein KDD14_14680 [Saprospiraceae bacterium]|nr:hypothetical protein [Saprospiraceae bacterium]
MKKYAVIDLGTNTFHLLIATPNGQGGWVERSRERIYVKLAEEGIDRIGDAAFDRALAALERFRQELDANEILPNAVRAYGTAALRTARNGQAFLDEAFVRTGLQIELIDGQREAQLIFKGVRQAVPFPDNRVLVMDIGGGSVEMVLALGDTILWQQSFPVGVALLFQYFHHSDPITEKEIAAVEHHLDNTLAELWQALELHSVPTLVGAAGAFDTIDHLLLDPASKHPLYGRVTVAAFENLCNQILQTTLAEREQMKNLAPERRSMIVVGFILIRHIIRRGNMREILTSVYSMKDGMLAEMI